MTDSSRDNPLKSGLKLPGEEKGARIKRGGSHIGSPNQVRGGEPIRKLDPTAFRAMFGKDYTKAKYPITLDFSSEQYKLESDEFLLNCPNIVRDMDLSGNALKEFTSASTSNLNKLKRLVLDDNAIVDMQFNGFEGLTYLSIENNQLGYLNDMSDLKHLVNLNLSGNRLTTGFNQLLKLKSVQVIDLSNNRIDFPIAQFYKSILKDLMKLPKLEYLTFLGNPCETKIEEFRLFVIAEMPKLKYLDWVVISKDERDLARRYALANKWDEKNKALERKSAITMKGGGGSITTTKEPGKSASRIYTAAMSSPSYERLPSNENSSNDSNNTTNETTSKPADTVTEEEVDNLVNTLYPDLKREDSSIEFDLKISEAIDSTGNTILEVDSNIRQRDDTGLLLDAGADDLSEPEVVIEECEIENVENELDNILEDIVNEDLTDGMSSIRSHAGSISHNNAIRSPAFNETTTPTSPNLNNDDPFSAILDTIDSLEATPKAAAVLGISNNATAPIQVSRTVSIPSGPNDSTNQKPVIIDDSNNNPNNNTLYDSFGVRIKPIETDAEDFEPWIIKNADIMTAEVLGKGSFGTSNRGVYKNKEVVVKKMFVQRWVPEWIEKFKMEPAVLSSLKHDNIANFYGVVCDVNLCTISEFVSGVPLYGYLRNSTNVMTSERIVGFARQITSGLKYLHQFNCIHSDLKPKNILIDRNENVKLSDYGMLTVKEETVKFSNGNFSQPHYLAPEQLNRGVISFATDIYSLCLVFLELFTRKPPFQDTPIPLVKDKILSGERPELPEFCPIVFKKVIVAGWNQEPSKRPKIEVVQGIMNQPVDTIMNFNKGGVISSPVVSRSGSGVEGM
eukprot:TRINITY_DN1099_c0_g1_i1.p1 TRINITY_DN1099_c0_g1~~TRINITY_DN1099_c0_g1_i1.p1  ORF type:complete len:848 (+),score=201.99 TRINITY_DN1099_c0_g1_i1:188-2731(+)